MKKFDFIKVMRIVTAFAAFDIQYIMRWIIGIRKKIVEQKIRDDPRVAEDTINDQN